MIKMYIYIGEYTGKQSPVDAYSDPFTEEKKDTFEIELPAIPRCGDFIHLTDDQEKRWKKEMTDEYKGAIRVWNIFFTVFKGEDKQHIQLSCSSY